MTKMRHPIVIHAQEFDEVNVPESLISESGELLAFPAVLQKDYFTVRYRKGRPVFQAGGYIGTIPINANVHLEITPKVPLGNLERVLFLANHSPNELVAFQRRYNSHVYSTQSIIEFIINAFLTSVDRLLGQGIYQNYLEKFEIGAFPKGRIDIQKSMQRQLRSPLPSAAYSWFERGPDNPPNRLLRYVLILVIKHSQTPRLKKRRHLAVVLLSRLGNVLDDENMSFLEDKLVKSPELFPTTKDAYHDSLALGKLILKGSGVAMSPNGREITGNILLINMGVAFEEYILAILRPLENGNIKILDGNIGGEMGARKPLFSPSSAPYYIGLSTDATPDIVIKKQILPTVTKTAVVEVKYKSVDNFAARGDINQLISYVFSYDADFGVLVLPAHGSKGLKHLGVIYGKSFYQYHIDLDSSEISKDEDIFREILLSLL